LVGPYTHNFAEATRLAVSAGAAIQVSDASGLATLAQSLFQDSQTLLGMRQQCAQFIEPNLGATSKSLQLIQQHLINSTIKHSSNP
jgi:3-deoxy-D-manno-octulosonic-acid transferase